MWISLEHSIENAMSHTYGMETRYVKFMVLNEREVGTGWLTPLG